MWKPKKEDDGRVHVAELRNKGLSGWEKKGADTSRVSQRRGKRERGRLV